MEPDRRDVVMSWSGGKDSALALAELLRRPRWRVVALLTSVAEEFGRVSHHGVREDLVRRQARALGLPLDVLRLPRGCTLADYDRLVGERMRAYARAGVQAVAHGDIFLEDLRRRRERKLASVGLRGLFPLWGRDTRELGRGFARAGFVARLCYVTHALGVRYLGRMLDERLLADLPAGVDPCGERGEYHSFVENGPIFSFPVPVRPGEIVERDTGYFLELHPDEERAGEARSPRP